MHLETVLSDQLRCICNLNICFGKNNKEIEKRKTVYCYNNCNLILFPRPSSALKTNYSKYSHLNLRYLPTACSIIMSSLRGHIYFYIYTVLFLLKSCGIGA